MQSWRETHLYKLSHPTASPRNNDPLAEAHYSGQCLGAERLEQPGPLWAANVNGNEASSAVLWCKAPHVPSKRHLA